MGRSSSYLVIDKNEKIELFNSTGLSGPINLRKSRDRCCREVGQTSTPIPGGTRLQPEHHRYCFDVLFRNSFADQSVKTAGGRAGHVNSV